MPYWNEIPGAGQPRPLNRSRRTAMRHGILAGFAFGTLVSVYMSYRDNSDGHMMTVLNMIAGVFVFGPFTGLALFAPFLGIIYQWRLIRHREKNGIPHPTPHSYGGNKWLELDDDDPLRLEVDMRIRAVLQSNLDERED